VSDTLSQTATTQPAGPGPTAGPQHQPPILYSTCSWLAYAVAEQYYGRVHYAWCSPYFMANGPLSTKMPPTAVPGLIYTQVKLEVGNGDRHSPWIARNKIGIVRGAQVDMRAASSMLRNAM